MRTSVIKRLAVRFGVASVAAASVLAFSGPANAAQPGDLCKIGGGAGSWVPIFSRGDLPYQYYQGFAGELFRVVGYSDINYVGHTQNHPDGLLRRDYVVQSTCYTP